MVDSEKIEEQKEKIDAKIDESKEKFEDIKEEQKEKFDENKEKFENIKEEQKEKFNERKEKGKNIADNVINELYKNLDDFKDSLKNVQKTADQKYNDYKNATVQNLDADFIETKDTYHIKVAVPGIEKEDILIEACDNDICIEATFDTFMDEFEEDETAEVISSSLKKGKCTKTIRFGNSIDLENITAKFNNGIVTITLPKLIIPKHKVNVE